MEIKTLNDWLNKLLKVETPWEILKIEHQENLSVLDIHIGFKRGTKFSCPQCGTLCKVHDSSEHRIRHLDCFNYRSYLNVKVPRIKCETHGVKVIERLPWGHTGKHYSFFFEELIMRLAIEMSMSAVSKELGEPDTNLWRVFNSYVSKAIAEQINLKDTRRIGVDETANKRGHNYVTIFTDLDTGDVIKVEDGRKKEVFEKLYGWLFDKEGHPSKIELFSMDMSVSYKAGCRENFAHSEIVFDRFHIKKVINEAVDKVRKAEVKHCEELKKTKYIWLKNEQNLNEQQKLKLHEFLAESSLNTCFAYKLKIEFDKLWSVQLKAIEPMLEAWMQRVLNTKIAPMISALGTIKNNYDGIIKSMKTGITNAAAEGLNSIVQMAKSRARGFRNMENFKAMIYALGNDFNFKFHTK